MNFSSKAAESLRFSAFSVFTAAAATMAAMSASGFECSAAAREAARRFIEDEKQFHLGFLPTEQSNPITATLEEDFKRSVVAGVQCLQRGDRQIPITMRHVFASKEFDSLVGAMVDALRSPDGRIVFSGCGATGRLSILLESMWRDFFHRRAAELSPAERALADRAASIMTGGDFALIKSVEFFEDFAEGGRRQAAALGVKRGDTFVAITEGGETSSVLGTLRYASEHGARCFLVFNNPAYLLRGYLDRCREAIDDPNVTVIDLYCGSMSVAGSTRMQATTSEQLLCSCALEAALARVVPRFARETAPDYTVAFERLLAALESPDQALVVELQQHVGLEKLGLDGGGAHGQHRLHGEDGRTLGDGPDVAGELEVFEVVEKSLAENAAEVHRPSARDRLLRPRHLHDRQRAGPRAHRRPAARRRGDGSLPGRLPGLPRSRGFSRLRLA